MGGYQSDMPLIWESDPFNAVLPFHQFFCVDFTFSITGTLMASYYGDLPGEFQP